MSIALLDVNVLVSLFDPAHLNHDEAHHWFGRNRSHGWATCATTINGCVRVLSNPVYPSFRATPADVVSHLVTLCADSNHQFWSESVSLLDSVLIRPREIAGHQQITDVYLLALAVRMEGRLATFDRRIPVKAVAGGRPEHLELLGRKRLP